MTFPSQYSVWLLPAPDQEAALRQTVQRLSTLWGEAAFLPHVTIQGDIALPLEALEGAVAKLAGETAVQRWRVGRVETSEHFFRCLYLRFAQSPAFDAMQDAVQKATCTALGLSPFAHLSLAYGNPGPEKDHERTSLDAVHAGQTMVFDRLTIARSSKDVPIADWKCLAQYALKPPEQ